MPYVWRKLGEGNAVVVSHLCVGPKAECLYLPFGTDKPIHQAASGAQTELWHPRAEGFIGLAQGLINLLWLPFSGFLSRLYGLTKPIGYAGQCFTLSLRRRQCYTSCVFEGPTGSDSSLAKEFFTVASRRHNDKPRGLYFLSHSLTLSICPFCRTTLLWLATFSLSFFSFTFWRNKSFVLLARCHFLFFFLLSVSSG